jgi:peptide/nickel transport system ATP-binding protein
MTPLVEVSGLTVSYPAGRARRLAVADVGFDIRPGEAFGLVGASGSGKSTIALAFARGLPRGAELSARRLKVGGADVLTLSGEALRRYRTHDIGVVFQEPARALNPTATIGAQVAETQLARGVGRRDAAVSAIGALSEVGLPDPEAIARRYPHELSGGQQQRAMIAVALATRPRLLILDEPTTGLDTISQADILTLVDRLQRELGFASLLISHDLGVVAAHCDRVAVLEDGRWAEARPSSRSVSLVRPDAPAIVAEHRRRGPEEGAPVVVTATGLTKRYGSQIALDDVDLRLVRGETLGLVGASGSGKTTLGRVVAGLLTPSSGRVTLHAPASPPPVQMVFQSPDASLNPRRTVRQTLGRAIQLLAGDGSVEDLADRVGIPRELLGRLPGELSGGQRQRVAIARAFAGRSPIIVCDEPTSALDADLRGTILDLLAELQDLTGAAFLLISHDLAVVRRLAHRVAVMQHGRIVETGPVSLLDGTRHPATLRLVAAARSTAVRRRRASVAEADAGLY